MPSRAKLRPLTALRLLRPSAAATSSAGAGNALIPKLVAASRSYSSQDARCASKGEGKRPTFAKDPPPKRWYGDLHKRIGTCIMFGCTPAQIERASTILAALAAEWRELIAGSEGFLTGPRRGLEGQQVVWGEQDSMQHVNNVTYVRYTESSRVNWILQLAHHVDNPANREIWAELMTPKSIGLILKKIEVSFQFPVTYPDKVSVYHKLRDHPDSAPSPHSLQLDAIVLSHRHRRTAAVVLEEDVVYDYRAGKKTEVLPFMKEVLAKTYDLQHQEKLRARERIWELIDAVTKLEKETWDRPDAVEDLGGAAKSK